MNERADEHDALTDKRDINLNNPECDRKHETQASTTPHDRGGRDADATVGREPWRQRSVLEVGAVDIAARSYCT